MKRKQLLAAMLAGTMALGAALLAGCGQETPGTQAETEAQAETETEDGGQQSEGQAAEDAGGENTDRDENGSKTEQPDGASAQEDAVGANGLSFRLTRALLEEKEAGENFLTSPYSAWLPLAALSNATDEDAKDALFAALGAAGLNQEAFNERALWLNGQLMQEERRQAMEEAGETFEQPLRIANAFFIGEGEAAKEDFLQLFEAQYGGKIFQVNFTEQTAVEEVNAWASEQTEGKIEQVVDSFDPSTVAAIANAIYFSDGWSTAFSKEETQVDTFHGAKAEEEVPFMNHKFTENLYYEDEAMQVTALPTNNGGQLILLLPKEGRTAEEVLAGMSQEKLDAILNGDYVTVQLSLPKFRMESGTVSIKEALEALGVPLMNRANPHLDGIVEVESLFISDAVQKAMIEVDEEGLTAAAVTVMGISRMSMPIETEPVELTFDRPFAFVLTQDTENFGAQVLFAGVVNTVAE